MIVTLTPNPSVDRTVSITALQRGEVQRATASRIDPGGKGVNISRALTAHKARTVAVLPAGGPEGHLLAELLAEAGIDVNIVPIGGSIRANLALVEPDGTTTKINEQGPLLSGSELEALLAGVRFVGFDLVEVSPAYDGPGQATSLLAASVAYEFLALTALAGDGGSR